MEDKVGGKIIIISAHTRQEAVFFPHLFFVSGYLAHCSLVLCCVVFLFWDRRCLANPGVPKTYLGTQPNSFTVKKTGLVFKFVILLSSSSSSSALLSSHQRINNFSLCRQDLLLSSPSPTSGSFHPVRQVLKFSRAHTHRCGVCRIYIPEKK